MANKCKCRYCKEIDQSKFHHRKTVCDECFEKRNNIPWKCPICGTTDLSLKEKNRHKCKKCRGKQSWDAEKKRKVIDGKKKESR